MNKILKATLLLVFLCFISTVSNAQFLQGTKTAGGGVGYIGRSEVRQDEIENKTRDFYLNVNGGYLIEDNIEVGFNAGVSTYSYENLVYGVSQKNRSTIFRVGPYARLYSPITDVVGLFGEGGFSVGLGGGSGTRRRSFETGIRPGVILMVNQNLGLEAKIGFVGYQRDVSGNKDNYSDSKVANNTFRATFDLSTISFGFRLYLRN